MNRAERRRQAKSAQAKPKTYVLTQEQIDDMKKKVADEATYKAFLMFMCIPVMVLHDKFGFGKTRIQRFMDYAQIWYKSVLEGETPLREILDLTEAMCGLRFEP